MSPRMTLWMTAEQSDALYQHLFPGDGKEAVAVALCGRGGLGDAVKLSVHELLPIPYDQCHIRTEDQVVWPTDSIVPLLVRAQQEGMSLLKIHSHPGGFDQFSETDDRADKDLFDGVSAWLPRTPHASVIMLPNRRMFGRTFFGDGTPEPLNLIGVIGDNIDIYTDHAHSNIAGQEATEQIFGSRTTQILSSLRVAVVGTSGTGSVVVEQLLRSGVGEIIVIDDDVVLHRNLNRILHATRRDAELRRPKVDIAEAAAIAADVGTHVTPIPLSLFTAEAIALVAGADVLFGCVDTAAARVLMNRISTFHTMPYFDLGVRIDADGQGGVDYVGGAVHFLQPGRSTLQSRRAIDEERLRAEWLSLTDSDGLERLQGDGYLPKVKGHGPVVMSLNMHIASLAVLEFLARLHRFRLLPDRDFAVHGTSLSHGIGYTESEQPGRGPLYCHVGRGNCTPILGMPALQVWLDAQRNAQLRDKSSRVATTMP